jgi:hypothetical protein
MQEISEEAKKYLDSLIDKDILELFIEMETPEEFIEFERWLIDSQ